MLERTMIYLQKLALTFWLGEMLFFIAIFAPRVFKVLPRAEAGNLQGAIFPAYYMAGLICAVIVFGTTLATRGFDSWKRLLLIGFAGAVFAFSLWYVTPALNELRPLIMAEVPDAAAQEKFKFLHKLSVQTNGAALLALLALLAIL